MYDRCSDADIEKVKNLLKEGGYENEWLQAMEEVQTGLPSIANPDLVVAEDKLLKRIQKSASISTAHKNRYIWLPYAAAILILLSAAVFFIRPADNITAPELAKTKDAPSVAKDSVHKWIKLPDGTSVQLNANSHLDYPESFAGKKNREVSLTGEAYFDVKHDAAHPFIIHTGKIKTTVLGTAFNISAYSAKKGVTVTVTRGRVMVQDEQKTLAVLTPDQQLVWNGDRSAKKLNVNADAAIEWKKSDLIMDDITLEDAAKMITSRYGMNVQFKNDKVKDCRFTAAFLNSNGINQVLSVLGDITGATLQLKNHTIIIDGNGC